MDLSQFRLWDKIGLCLFVPICMMMGWFLSIIVLSFLVHSEDAGAMALGWLFILLLVSIPALLFEVPFYAWRHWLLKGIEPPSEAEAARRAAVVRLNRKVGWAAVGAGLVFGLVQGFFFSIPKGAA